MKSEQDKKILIIEDEAPMRRILKDTLEQEGYKVLSSSNGEEGLATAFSYRPDFILLDIIMPKMDGMSVLRRLRENKWGKKVPVLILTNLSEVSSVINALEFNLSDNSNYSKAAVIPPKVSRQYIKQYLNTRLENGVYDFLIKTDCKLEDIVRKVKAKLNNI